MFLSTHTNKVDKKGRVSIPASFRTTLYGGPLPPATSVDMVIFPSLKAPALDVAPRSYLTTLSEALDDPNMPEEQRELIETTVFGRIVEISTDTEGRIILPAKLLDYAGITENIVFVGRRKTFQIWDPVKHEEHEREMAELARAHSISLSTIVAKATALAKGA
ncbi:MraZ family transcriptional regulator [Niveispirillum sp. SYP-B3756]|uniref:division/cell wall cluster transcriptional repressor MraZ n=1 Tax=Niveispirillum sp. SYP-B3756 TaxID=2662178 RepID=UPI001290B470|nr:MraZ family transcriptional regulator [Niveispirillum sp. SYP-B3756]MQP67133.1 MraZ family transcriptional regulator [Niveispirillum sp. SYP-B3756]